MLPRSDVMCSGMPNLEIHPLSKSAVQEAEVVSINGIARPSGGTSYDGEEVAVSFWRREGETSLWLMQERAKFHTSREMPRNTNFVVSSRADARILKGLLGC